MTDSNKPAHGGYPDAVSLCACKDRPAAECQEQCGPNCDLGKNLKHERVFREPSPAQLEIAYAFARQRGMAFVVDGVHVEAERVVIVGDPESGPIAEMRQAAAEAREALGDMRAARAQHMQESQLIRYSQASWLRDELAAHYDFHLTMDQALEILAAAMQQRESVEIPPVMIAGSIQNAYLTATKEYRQWLAGRLRKRPTIALGGNEIWNAAIAVAASHAHVRWSAVACPRSRRTWT